MENDRLITGVYINSPGDESVGIFSAEWQINELCVNLAAEDLEHFRSGLKALFDNFIAEDCSVQTFEERIEQIRQEDFQAGQLIKCSNCGADAEIQIKSPIDLDQIKFICKICENETVKPYFG